MAIQHSYTTGSGIVLSDAYHRVLKTDLTRQVGDAGVVTDSAEGIVQIWKDATSRDQGLSPVQGFQLSVTGGDYTSFFGTDILDQTNVNSVAQMYDWMKTQTNLNGIDYTHDSTDV
jgi:hypothetical protein